jgi:hypothetical protein
MADGLKVVESIMDLLENKENEEKQSIQKK